MKHAVAYSLGRNVFCSVVAVMVFRVFGCCVFHSLCIKNNTGHFVAVASKDPECGGGIPPGKRKDLLCFQGLMVILEGNTIWFFPKIGYGDPPEATRRVFRFGICQAGFGYVQTRAVMEADGRLTVGQRLETIGHSLNRVGT